MELGRVGEKRGPFKMIIDIVIYVVAIGLVISAALMGLGWATAKFIANLD